jgi:hypothetical protein
MSSIPQDGSFTFVHGAEAASQRQTFDGITGWRPSDPPQDPDDDIYQDVDDLADSYVDGTLAPNIIVDGDGFQRPAGPFSRLKA